MVSWNKSEVVLGHSRARQGKCPCKKHAVAVALPQGCNM